MGRYNVSLSQGGKLTCFSTHDSTYSTPSPGSTNQPTYFSPTSTPSTPSPPSTPCTPCTPSPDTASTWFSNFSVPSSSSLAPSSSTSSSRSSTMDRDCNVWIPQSL